MIVPLPTPLGPQTTNGRATLVVDFVDVHDTLPSSLSSATHDIDDE
jgi:hypothetical protein